MDFCYPHTVEPSLICDQFNAEQYDILCHDVLRSPSPSTSEFDAPELIADNSTSGSPESSSMDSFPSSPNLFQALLSDAFGPEPVVCGLINKAVLPLITNCHTGLHTVYLPIPFAYR